MTVDSFIKVVDKENNTEHYGGNQAWFKSETAKGYGCGVIAFANCVLTHKAHGENTISRERFMHLAETLRKKYLPILPGLGINGIQLAIGANAYFLTHKIKAFASWGVMPKNLWAAVDKMLAAGWPVVLAIGPNNTLIGKKNLTMNSECKNETTRAHYVTITAADSVNIMVSSWGKKYTVSKKEYEDYMKKTSNPLFSNILYIR